MQQSKHYIISFLAALLLLMVPFDRLLAQKTITGQLVDLSDGSAIVSGHIVNKTQHTITSSNVDGEFSIEANPEDTIVLSCIGYKPEFLPVKSLNVDFGYFMMKRDTLYLKELPIYGTYLGPDSDPTILEVPREEFRYFTQPEIKERKDVTLSENYMKSPLAILSNPLSYFYYNFSKQEKERRKYHKISMNQASKTAAYSRYSREYVCDLTGLSGDDLTDFIAYCDLSVWEINRMTEYLLQEYVLQKYSEFQKLTPTTDSTGVSD